MRREGKHINIYLLKRAHISCIGRWISGSINTLCYIKWLIPVPFDRRRCDGNIKFWYKLGISKKRRPENVGRFLFFRLI